jgi:hypothetical protein
MHPGIYKTDTSAIDTYSAIRRAYDLNYKAGLSIAANR